MLKIKKDDEVVVITGKDKGKRGTVTKVMDDGRLLVSGVNIAKKHQRPNPQLGQQGGIVEQEQPIQASNVAIYNPKTQKADRVGFKVDGVKKVRVFKSSGDVVGVEIGGCVKNVVAIAAGISDGCGFGANAMAALETQALAC